MTTAEEMHRRVSNVANLLRLNEMAPGDRVLITMLPSADLYAAIIAVLAMGKGQRNVWAGYGFCVVCLWESRN